MTTATTTAPRSTETAAKQIIANKKARDLQNTLKVVKTTAQLIQEQKDFFANKNVILKKLRIFEHTGGQIEEVIEKLNSTEADSPAEFWEENKNTFVEFSASYNTLFKISNPVIVKIILVETLKEIEKSRKSLELQLLSK